MSADVRPRPRTIVRPLAAAAILCTLLLIGPVPPAAADTTELAILYNGAVRAEIDDCGCPSRPLGGLARRAHVIDGVRTDHPDAVLLDAGSLFGDPTRETLEQSRFVAEETAAMGYEVIGVGPYELGHGVDAVRQVAASTGLEFVSANVRRGGDLVFDPYTVIERDGVRIAVTSVIDPAYLDASYVVKAGDVEAGDPVAAMKTWLPEMDEKGDVVVILSSLRRSNSLSFLRQLHQGGFQQMDLIVDGIFDNALPRPRQFGPTRLLAANSQGKYVGQIDLTIEDGEVAGAENRIHYLDTDLPEDTEVASRVEDFRASTGIVAGGR
jgi:2',3'-cyclic-nucleotide 2'-phosphodiesterase (5'-nucleotidase family)